MPKQYEAMRDKFISDGMSTKAAKTKAAKIYNSLHKKKMSSHTDEDFTDHMKKKRGKNYMKLH